MIIWRNKSLEIVYSFSKLPYICIELLVYFQIPTTEELNDSFLFL